MTTWPNPLIVTNWRRTIAGLYSDVRRASAEYQPRVYENFRTVRNALFAADPASPLDTEQRAVFSGLDYYSYDLAYRVIGTVTMSEERESLSFEPANAEPVRYMRIGQVDFALFDRPAMLSLFWIEGYGGGLFVPFRDMTNGKTTYVGGRYLYDTLKGADLGADTDQLVLDFNYAYNPPCAYNALRVCPLAPDDNSLPFAVEAGEKIFPQPQATGSR